MNSADKAAIPCWCSVPLKRQALTASRHRGRLKRCARKSWRWMLLNGYLKMPRCMTSRRNCTQPLYVKDWKNWIEARESPMRRSNASSNHGLQNNLGSASAGGPQGNRSLYPPRQARSRPAVWRKIDRQGREPFHSAGTRASDPKIFQPGHPRSVSRPLPHRISHSRKACPGRDRAHLAWSASGRKFHLVKGFSLPLSPGIQNEVSPI